MARTQQARDRSARSAPRKVSWDCPVDRWTWAKAIYEGLEVFGIGLDGIAEDDGNRRRGPYAPVHDCESLGDALVCSSAYMDAYAEAEREYSLSSDCDDDWENDCQERGLDEGLSKKKIRELIKDSDARNEWAYERFDAPEAWDQIREDCKELESIYYLLKKHPVVAVRINRDSAWQRLADIIAFCPTCHAPLEESDVGTGVAGTTENDLSHDYRNYCWSCPSRVKHCAFDRKGYARPHIKCWQCSGLIFHKDDLDGDRERPLHWPPMLPYPPRRNFAGRPDGAPPWEDENE